MAFDWRARLGTQEKVSSVNPVPTVPTVPTGGKPAEIVAFAGTSTDANGPAPVPTGHAVGTVGTVGSRHRERNAIQDWSHADWQAFFDERAAIVEHDGGRTREEAERAAFDACVIEWLNQHPEITPHHQCAHCRQPKRDDRAILPYGARSEGRTWLHPECWPEWHARRVAEAEEALLTLGIANTNLITSHEVGA